METISQSQAAVTDRPTLTYIKPEDLPNTGRYSASLAEYMSLAGGGVFTLDPQDMPPRAIGVLWREPDTAAAFLVPSNLDPATLEDVVFSLIVRWMKSEPGQYATQYDGVEAIAIGARDGGAR